jgi:hypothetical protein
MLKATLCCVLIAATAATATQYYEWIELDGTPEDCGQGAHITYGAGSIWGVFPYADDGETWVAHYDPLPTNDDPPDGDWTELDDPVPVDISHHTGVTFQWTGGNALYVIGDDGNGQTIMTWYLPDDQQWVNSYIYEFSLSDGACIVFVPNLNYGPDCQVVGYIYCLPGNGNEFWRYGIEPAAAEYVSVQGIFPPDGSTIADQTPLFKWNYADPGQYRLQVSTDELFSTTVIDEVVYVPQFQVTSKLANATYYWRIGLPNGINWLWGTTHTFVLQGGFVQVSSIPEAVANGAAMVYEGDPWSVYRPYIFAAVGGGSTNFYRYNMATGPGGWTPENWLKDTPKPQYPGTSLTSNDPTEEYGQWPAAAFGGSTTSDHPWSYESHDPPNDMWVEFPGDNFEAFQQPLGAGACFVAGPRPWSYLTTGEQDGEATDYFYAIEPKHIKHPHGGGSQSGDAYTGSIPARVIATYDGIAVEYQVPVATHVRATLHDAVGRQVGMLDAGSQQPGTHRLSWSRNGEEGRLRAGAYFVLLDLGIEQIRLKAITR